MSIYLTIKNKKHRNPRTTMPKKKALFSLVEEAGETICFVVENKGSAGVKN